MIREVLHTSYEKGISATKTIEDGKYVLKLCSVTSFDADAEMVILVGLNEINKLRDFINKNFPPFAKEKK